MASLRRTRTEVLQAQFDKVHRQDELRDELLKRQAAERLLDATLASEDRIDDKRLIRLNQLMETERQYDEKIRLAEEKRRVAQSQREQDEKLALELERIKLQKLREEKMRQQIRENSSELRELETLLKNAYTSYELDAQRAEKLARNYDVTARDSEISRAMMEESERAREAEMEREKEIYAAKIRYQQELERQLEYKEYQKQESYGELLKDKLMIDEITRKIFEEDERELIRRRQKKEATRQYIDDFMTSQRKWKELEEEKMAEENRMIMKFATEQKAREDQFNEQKKARDQAKEHAQAKLSEQIAGEERHRREMEDIRTELHLEEQEEIMRQRERDDIEKKLRQRIEMRQMHAEQMHFKAMREQAQKDEDERFRKQMLAKFAEDDRIEQMDAQKRRMKREQHKRQVEELLVTRRKQFAMDKERELEERRQQDEMERFRQRIVEEERLRLLREHATKLVGYLPKGVFRTEADLDVLPPEHRQRYKPKPPGFDDFDDSGNGI